MILVNAIGCCHRTMSLLLRKRTSGEGTSFINIYKCRARCAKFQGRYLSWDIVLLSPALFWIYIRMIDVQWTIIILFEKMLADRVSTVHCTIIKNSYILIDFQARDFQTSLIRNKQSKSKSKVKRSDKSIWWAFREWEKELNFIKYN